MTAVELAWDCRCGTGESPVWDERNGRVIFTDIPRGAIHTYWVATGATRSWNLPEVTPSLGLCRSGRLVVALRSRVVLFDPESERVTELCRIDQPPSVRLNDGKVGPDGCFWVGGMDEGKPRQPNAALWRVTPDGRAERRQEGYCNSNGLAWSPDGTMMWHADTTPGKVEAFDVDAATGGLANRRALVTFTDAQGRPDGGATDAFSHCWSAGNSAACLHRIAPDGLVVDRIELPVPRPTMPCFAGEWLFVTTLREGVDAATLERHPTMGGLFRLRAPVGGAPVGVFEDG
jgi:sugar lactone lactonase YvrE